MVIVVSGPLDIIRYKLLAISATVKHRKYNGWVPYQSDETWWYITHPERSIEGVCPVCLGFEATENFSGNEIPSNFPTAEQINPLRFIHPRVHLAHPELRGECQCELLWFNAREILVDRLTREIEAVSL